MQREQAPLERGALLESSELLRTVDVGEAGEEVEEEEDSAPKEPTTFMVRNIGYRLTAAKAREHLETLGFDGAYDFLYLPMFPKGKSNQGYFFVNFRAPQVAAAFRERLQGQPLGSTAKLCDVTVAEWQGLAELRQHFRKKRVMQTEHRPLFS